MIFMDSRSAQVAALGATVAFVSGTLATLPATRGRSPRARRGGAPAFTLVGRVPGGADRRDLRDPAGAALLLVDRARGAEHMPDLVGNISPWLGGRAQRHRPRAVGIARAPRAGCPKAGCGVRVLRRVARRDEPVASPACCSSSPSSSFRRDRRAVRRGLPRQARGRLGHGDIDRRRARRFVFTATPTGATLVCAYGVALAIAGLARLPRPSRRSPV